MRRHKQCFRHSCRHEERLEKSRLFFQPGDEVDDKPAVLDLLHVHLAEVVGDLEKPLHGHIERPVPEFCGEPLRGQCEQRFDAALLAAEVAP